MIQSLIQHSKHAKEELDMLNNSGGQDFIQFCHNIVDNAKKAGIKKWRIASKASSSLLLHILGVVPTNPVRLGQNSAPFYEAPNRIVFIIENDDSALWQEALTETVGVDRCALIGNAYIKNGVITGYGHYAHPILVTPTGPIEKRTPLRKRKINGLSVTEYDLRHLKTNDFWQVVFSCSSGLTVVRTCEEALCINTDNLPLDNADTFSLLSSGNTIGVYHSESEEFMTLLKEKCPATFPEFFSLFESYFPVQETPAVNRIKNLNESYVTYQNAFLKANYPETFMAAVLTEALSDLERVQVLISECERLKLHFCRCA